MAVYNMKPKPYGSSPSQGTQPTGGGIKAEAKPGYGNYTKPVQPPQRPSIPAPSGNWSGSTMQKWGMGGTGGGVSAPAPDPIPHPMPFPMNPQNPGGPVSLPAPNPIPHPMPMPGGFSSPAPPPIPNPMPFPQSTQPIGQRLGGTMQQGGALAGALSRRQGMNPGGQPSQTGNNFSTLMQMLR